MGDFRRFVISFRCFVISISEAILVIGMIGGTLGFAMYGLSVGQKIARASGSYETGGVGFFGFVIGGAIGFAVSAMAAAIVFMLAETAANTKRASDDIQRLVDIVERATRSLSGPNADPVRDSSSTGTIPIPSALPDWRRESTSRANADPVLDSLSTRTIPIPSALPDWRLASTVGDTRASDNRSGFPYSEKMQAIFEQAKSRGYDVKITDTKVTIARTGEHTVFCYSTYEVIWWAGRENIN